MCLSNVTASEKCSITSSRFFGSCKNEMMNDSDESDDYSEDNDNMNQNNTESEEDFPEKEVQIATQDPEDTSEDEIAVPMADSTLQTNNEFVSTDGSQRWSKVPINPNTGRMRLQNVLNQSPGPISAVVQRSDSVLGIFSCFITTEMLKKIANYTNEEGQTQIPNSWVDVSVDELRKYFGLRLLAGVYSANKEAVTQLWKKETGRHIFDNTMARNRFLAITWCLRFDSKINRPARRAQDKLAPIRDFCNQIFAKFRGNFRPSENLCVDEHEFYFVDVVHFEFIFLVSLENTELKFGFLLMSQVHIVALLMSIQEKLATLLKLDKVNEWYCN